MKDLGIQERTIEAARKFLRDAPNAKLAPLARDLAQLGLTHGSYAPATAEAANTLYFGLRALDRDGDGTLTPQETPDANAHDELLRALQTNDVDGDGDLVDELPEVGSAKPTATVQPAFDIGRRAVGFTLWHSRGARYAFEQSRANIERIEPDFLFVHTDPYALANGGGQALTDDIRKAYPSIMVAWAWYGDSYGPDPSAAWERAARAGERALVETLMPNTESAHKSLKRGNLAQRNALARKGMIATRRGAPTRHISDTSFDGWVSIVYKGRRWGGHESMPIEGLFGEGSPCNAEAPQVYIAASDTGEGATVAAAIDRFERHELSRAAAVQKKLVSPHVEPWMYMQAHHSRPGAVCYLAERRRVAIGWAGPSRIDEQGIRGLAAAVKIARMRDDSGASLTVRGLQARMGLTVDGDAGPKTLAALKV